MVRIYGSPLTRAHRVLWMLEEAGIAYQNIPLNTIEELEGDAGFQALNPGGKVPTLVDGDLVLCESLAINLHLARSRGVLAPSDDAGWARAFQWTLWVASEVEEPVFAAFRNRALLPEAGRDAAVADAAEEKLARPLASLERTLEGTREGRYLLGEAFTVVDINVASILLFALHGKVDLSRAPATAAWLARCFARPAARKVFGDFAVRLPG